MCKTRCEHPNLKPKDGQCSEELIKHCHGQEKNHPCDDSQEEPMEDD